MNKFLPVDDSYYLRTPSGMLINEANQRGKARLKLVMDRQGAIMLQIVLFQLRCEALQAKIAEIKREWKLV